MRTGRSEVTSCRVAGGRGEMSRGHAAADSSGGGCGEGSSRIWIWSSQDRNTES